MVQRQITAPIQGPSFQNQNNIDDSQPPTWCVISTSCKKKLWKIPKLMNWFYSIIFVNYNSSWSFWAIVIIKVSFELLLCICNKPKYNNITLLSFVCEIIIYFVFRYGPGICFAYICQDIFNEKWKLAKLIPGVFFITVVTSFHEYLKKFTQLLCNTMVLLLQMKRKHSYK